MKKEDHPFYNRDLHLQLRFPVLSWSSVSSWSYNKEQWYERYYLGVRGVPNSAMKIGIEVGDRLITDPTFLPSLERPDIFEKNLTATIGDITITGHIDGWFEKGIDEYKTSLNKDRWTQKKVDEHGQIDFYCLLRYLNEKVKPEDLRLRLWAIPIKEHGDFSWEAQEPICFHTKRTMADILRFAAYLQKTHKEMSEFIHTRDLTRLA